LNTAQAERIRLYFAQIGGIDPIVLERVAAEHRLDPNTVKRRKKEFLVGRALAHFAVEDSIGLPASKQTYELTPNGKPVCVGGPPLSLSHSRDWVVCALSMDGDVGVDLQFPTAHTQANEIAARYFGPEESDWVRAGDRARFFMLWTLKEAYLKAIGVGVAGGLDSLVCRIEPPIITASFSAFVPLSLALFACDDGFLSVAAAGASNNPPEFRVWTPGNATPAVPPTCELIACSGT
jgi:phosphopantetheinyl transferase